MLFQPERRTSGQSLGAYPALFSLLLYSLAGLLMLGPKPLCAQPVKQKSYKQVQVKTLNFEDGLMNNAAFDVATDIMGYTWVSTEVGLQRYNGYRLEKIMPVVGTDSIPIRSPVALFALRSGMFWIFYRQGILEYSPFTSSYRQVTKFPPSPNFFYPVIPICETSEGLWCLLLGKTLAIYDLQGQLHQQFPMKDLPFIGNIFELGYSANNRLYTANNNHIFIRDSAGGILQVDLQTHQFKTIPWTGPLLTGIACDSTHLYLLSATGLFQMQQDGTGHPAYLPLSMLIGETINNANVTFTKGNELLLGVNNRLFQVDSSLRSWKEFITPERKPVVTTGYVNFLYADQFRRLWMLSNDDVRRVRDVGLPFQHFLYPSAPNNFVRCLYQDETRHFILAGCFNGGVQLYDTTGRPLWNEPLLSDSTKDIIGIAKLKGDDFLLTTLTRGWYLLRLKQKKISPVRIDPALTAVLHPRNNQFGNNLQSINDSTVFIATADNVYRCLFRNRELKEASAVFPQTFIQQNRIRCFVYTSDHSVWAGSDKGVIYTVNARSELNRFQIRSESPIRSIIEDRQHRIWAGSEKGAYVYSSEGEWKMSVSTDNGLLNDCIYAMLPLPNENAVIASSNLGLSYISSNGNVRNFTREMGLQENEFNTNSCWASSNGKFLFGGVNGISAFYPAALTEIRDTPILNIIHLTVNDTSYQFPSAASSGDSIQLEYNHNHLAFDIAALGLLNTSEYNYRYRLRGFETSWQSTRNPRGIRYTLSPGTYTLEIVCGPLHSAVFNVARNFTIVINPPWWQRWWALTLELVALVATVAFVVWRYNRWKYQKKIRALQTRNELQNERERISRELHDNIGTQLSLISSNMDWLIESSASLHAADRLRRLSAINETAKDLVADLRETIWAIKKEAIHLDELADKLKMFILSRCAPDPSIELEIKERIQENYSLTPVEALNIFRICQEALVNIFKHAKASRVFLSIESNDSHTYVFIVSDNGKGFIHTDEFRGHYGLENMRHRALEIGAMLQVESSPGHGTTILLEKKRNRLVGDLPQSQK